jgi:2-methylcitrate dehydratase PrpD
VDGCLRLQRQHGFAPHEISHIQADVPPLIHNLVGRPGGEAMTTNYARLCAQYVTAHALGCNGISVDAYEDANLQDTQTIALARCIQIDIDDNPDPNALVPVTITITLKDGGQHAITVADVYGSPANPMRHQAHLEKFRNNCAAAPRPLAGAAVEALIERIEDLETLDDVTKLVDLMIPVRNQQP